LTHPHREHALTETYGLFLIALLISAAVILILGVSSGFVTSVLQKPPVFAVQVKVISPSADKQVITLYHMEGEPVAFSNLSTAGATPGVFFTLESPYREKIAVYPSPVMTGDLWTKGGTATLYYDGSRFRVTDDLATLIAKKGSGAIKDMPSGIWIVYITDQKTQVVVNSLTVTV
jgi:hypothetical protein